MSPLFEERHNELLHIWYITPIEVDYLNGIVKDLNNELEDLNEVLNTIQYRDSMNKQYLQNIIDNDFTAFELNEYTKRIGAN